MNTGAGRSVVVTGVSSGIGQSCAQALIAAGYRVYGSVRRESDATRLSLLWGPSFSPLRFDVTDGPAVAAAAARVAAELGGRNLFGLINNAGIAVPGPLLHVGLDDFRRQLEVNVTAQLAVTQAFAPLLGLDTARTGPPGRIVMMSSGSGRSAPPFLGPYCASKFALEGLSESLRRELMLVGIKVVIVAPSSIATPIWDHAQALDASRYADTRFAAALQKARDYMIGNGKNGLAPEAVAATVMMALTSRQPKIRYALSPHPLRRRLLNALPRRVMDRVIARRLGIK